MRLWFLLLQILKNAVILHSETRNKQFNRVARLIKDTIMKNIILGLSLLMSIAALPLQASKLNPGTTVSMGSSNSIKTNMRYQHDKQMAGGYTQQRKLTKQDKKLFKSTYKEKEKLTPISVSTQVVNGTNYKFICKDKHGNKVTVIIYQSLPHMGSKSKIVHIDK